MSPAGFGRLTIAAVAATAARDANLRGADLRPPHDCRSRGDCGLEPAIVPQSERDTRLTIAAVAATAAALQQALQQGVQPPHDCRSRGDCG